MNNRCRAVEGGISTIAGVPEGIDWTYFDLETYRHPPIAGMVAVVNGVAIGFGFGTMGFERESIFRVESTGV